MTAIRLIFILIMSLLGESGWSSHYAPHVMSWQVDYHMLVEPCDGCAVASVSCDDIGDYWIIEVNGRYSPVVVADCAGDVETVQWMESNNIILELSYELAEASGCVDRSCPVKVWRIPDMARRQ